MKTLFLFSALALASLSANAAEVTGARLENNGKDLIVSVVHGGGCGTHKYDLDLQGCAESMPVQCKAVLKHTGRDNCEAIISREAKFNLATLGIKGDYYANGSLTIKGDNNSSATVRLPGNPTPDRPLPGGKTVECVTHTGSILVINERLRTVTIETTSGEKSSYKITATEAMVLESMPPQYQTTYKLDDGRSVVTNFRDTAKTGTGNFIRIGGEYSPEFKSCRK